MGGDSNYPSLRAGVLFVLLRPLVPNPPAAKGSKMAAITKNFALTKVNNTQQRLQSRLAKFWLQSSAILRSTCIEFPDMNLQKVQIAMLEFCRNTDFFSIGKYAQVTNNPENDGCINAVLLV